jgi:translation initiation factor 2 beta subunit (eIF-2beta)/eIF-5
MFHDLKATYWWYEIKRDVAEYVAVCGTCQRVETEHQRRARMFQLLQIPKSK